LTFVKVIPFEPIFSLAAFASPVALNRLCDKSHKLISLLLLVAIRSLTTNGKNMFAICTVHVGTGAMLAESLDNFQSCALLLATSGIVNDILVIVYQIDISIIHEGSLDHAGIALSGTSHK
jgi:hypothetical protein